MADAGRRTRFARLLSEALANVVARPFLSTGSAAVAAVLIMTVFVAEANAVVDTRVYADDLLAAGYSTLYVEPAGSRLANLTADDCAAMGALSGVHATMWYREPEPFELWGTRGPSLSVRPVGGDVHRFLAGVAPDSLSGLRAAQAFVDIESSTASATPHEHSILLAAGMETHQLAAVTVPLSALGQGAAGNVMVIDPNDGGVAGCVAHVADDSRTSVIAAIDTAYPSLLGYSHRWALGNADRFDTPETRFTQRASRDMWLAAALTFVLAWIMNLRIRRSDFALYSVAGLTPRSLATLACSELVIILTGAVAAAAAVTAAAVIRHGDTSTDALATAANASGRSALAMLLVGLVWSSYATSRNSSSTLEAIKDR